MTRLAARSALLIALAVVAAPAPAAELFAGYSVLGIRGDVAHGVALGAGYVRPGGRLRLGVEGSAHSGDSAGESVRELGLLAGGALVTRAGARLSPFVSLKAGVVGARRQVEVFGTAIGPDGVCPGDCPYDFGPALEIGGGLDAGLGARWAVRLGADYRLRRLAGSTERGLRLSAGIVRR